MSRKRKIVFSTIVILVAIDYVIYRAFFDIQRLKGQEVLQEVSSPGNTYTVTLYRNNGGATTSYSILGAVKNNETGKERNIYWMYPCEDDQIQWIDDVTVIINGIELDVRKDAYDYRRD